MDEPILTPDEQCLQQIQLNKQQLAGLGVFDTVLISSLKRTKMTAEAYGYKTLTVEPLLNELSFGKFEGKTKQLMIDELGDVWQDSVLHRTMEVDLNGDALGRADAGTDATFSLARLVSHAAKSRNLRAGAIIGSGTVSNRDADGGPGRPVADGGRGYSCLAEIRMVETIRDGRPATPFMRFGDRVGIEMHDDDGASIFGRIDQVVEEYHG